MWREYETSELCIEALQKEIYTQQGLLAIAERENEKLRQEVAQLETVVQRQKEQLRKVTVYYPRDFSRQAE